MDEKKLKALDDMIAGIDKQFGKGTLQMLGKAPRQHIEVIPSGCVSLDYALGVGGVPRGRVIEIFGPESSGKTTACLQIVAEAQKLGGTAAFVDAEHALDVTYSKAIGVDVDSLLLSQPDCGEDALEIVDTIVKSGLVDIIVVDSVAALTPRAELEGEMGQAHMALQARLMGQALRKLTSSISKTKTCVIFINQLRDNVGNSYGPSERTTGGNALKFYASVRLDIRRIAAIKDSSGGVYGNRTKIKVVKNKVAAPFKEVEVLIRFGKGIDQITDVIEVAEKFGIVKKAGAWFTYKEERFQGRENLYAYLDSDPEEYQKLREQVVYSLTTGEITPGDVAK